MLKMTSLVALVLAAVTCVAAQDIDLANFQRCARLSTEQYCTNYAELQMSSLNAAVQCNDAEIATAVASTCVRDTESGFYCGAAIAYSRDIGSILFACATPLAGAACTDDCRASLMDIRENLGCCINSGVNSTNSIFGQILVQAFSYGLWSRCGVSPPNSTCTDALPYTLPGAVQTSCNVREAIGCSQAAQDALVRVVSQTALSGCDVLVDYDNGVCSQRPGAARLCFETIDQDTTTYVTPIQTSCATAVATQTCSSACKGTLESFVANRGCCVNTVYNSTYARGSGLNFTASLLEDYRLFEVCEVEAPPLTCASGSMPFKMSTVALFLPLIITMVFGKKLM